MLEIIFDIFDKLINKIRSVSILSKEKHL
jgi:hypothetical protein